MSSQRQQARLSSLDKGKGAMHHQTASYSKRIPSTSTHHDSSDDELPVPMKLSALTKALLNNTPESKEHNDDETSKAPNYPNKSRSHLQRPPAHEPLPIASRRSSGYSSRGGERPEYKKPISTAENGQPEASQTNERQTARHSDNRPPSPLSPVRKRVVRLTSTPRTSSGQLRRQSNSGGVVSDLSSTTADQGQDERSEDLSELTGSPSDIPTPPDSGRSSNRQASTYTSTAGPYEVTGTSNSPPTSTSHTNSGARRVAHSKNPDHNVDDRSQSYRNKQQRPTHPNPTDRVEEINHHVHSTPNATASTNNSSVPPQSGLRLKRVGNIRGSFLSGPARRGRRRQSDNPEEREDGSDDEFAAQSIPFHATNEEEDDDDEGDEDDPSNQRSRRSPIPLNPAPDLRSNDSQGHGTRSQAPPSPPRNMVADLPIRPSRNPSAAMDMDTYLPSSRSEVAHEPIPIPPVKIPPSLDQENGLDRRRSTRGMKRPSSAAYLSHNNRHDQNNQQSSLPPTSDIDSPQGSVSHHEHKNNQDSEYIDRDIVDARNTPPQRKPLISRNQNTPHRPAPPPPNKQSNIDLNSLAANIPPASTTTTSRGLPPSSSSAAPSQSKQRRNIIKVNGKIYTRLDCLGKGGSGKVYRVTGEDGKMRALKRISLETADEATMRGYRGEIDLLTKLSGVARVISLYDYELNNEKHTLTLVMEMGELDMNTLLQRQKSGTSEPSFDPVFVRYYWKEMLECLQSVHEHDIVHSDLKPANFVIVQGRLKLIDFGIANAIQTDETVNVHRDTQIGTPNYMSPESLIDSNASARVSGRLPGQPRLMKLGKPSDVWSLGCILYQMVYGTPPFGHITNLIARCQAIINWDHDIEFPSRGMGGVRIPISLIRTMKRCLTRDIPQRPTCHELLQQSDPFLYPVELDDRSLPIDEELLGRIIESVVTRCRERMPTETEMVSTWPAAYWAGVAKAMNPKR